MEKEGSPSYKRACGRRLRIARHAIGYPNRSAFVRLMVGDDDEELFKAERSRLEKWESGVALVPPAFVDRLKKIFGVTPDYIYSNDTSGLRRDFASEIRRLETEDEEEVHE